jgi:transcriptional regulator of heat shock response
MAKLENLELLYQPYNSAGRLPTAKGLRAFVNYLMQTSPDYFLQQQNNQKYYEEVKKI